MKTLYVVSSQYMPLIAKEDPSNPSERAMRINRIIYSQKITKEKLAENFNSSTPLMMAFKTKDEAEIFMGAALRGNTTNPDFIEGKIPFFAVPVMYAVELDENLEHNFSVLEGKHVLSYMKTETIPFFYSDLEQGMWKESAIAYIGKKIKTAIEENQKLNVDGVDEVLFCQVPRENLKVIEAFYWGCNPTREVQMSFVSSEKDLNKAKAHESSTPLEVGCKIL